MTRPEEGLPDEARQEPRKEPREQPPDKPAATPKSDPLWQERAVSRWEMLRRRPRARATTALVFATRGGEQLEFTADRQPTYGEVFWSAPQTLYEVDTSLRRTVLTDRLPSEGDAFEFTAKIVLGWRVVRPAATVSRGVHDIGAELESRVLAVMRRISRGFAIDQPAAAENAVNGYFAEQAAEALRVLAGGGVIDPAEEDLLPIGVAYGVQLRAVVELGLDAKAVEIASVSRQVVLERETQVLRVLQEENSRGLTDKRIEYFREVIEQGDPSRFALQLANNPQDTAAVIDAIHAQAATNRAQTIDFVSRLVDSGAISGYEIEDQVREALGWLKEATNRVIGTPLGAGGAAIPARRRNADEPSVGQRDAVLPPADPSRTESEE